MKRVKVFVLSLLLFFGIYLQSQTPSHTTESGKSVAVSNVKKSSKEVSQSGDFEIVVSSYQNNGIKTIIVTRNKNNNFFDRIEWVGKGEIPIELRRLMGKEKSLPSEANYSSKKIKKSYFGVVISDSEIIEEGVVVEEVVTKSPAFKLGLKKGDIINGIAGEKISNTDSFAKILSETPAGEVVVCRFFRGDRLNVERIALEKVPEGTGLNLSALDGGDVFASRIERAPSNSISNMPAATGGKDIYSKSQNLALSNFNAFITPNNDWLNISFNGNSLPLSVIVLDSKGNEVFHQHLSWFQGNYKQLIKINTGVFEPFQIVVAQGAGVFSQLVKKAK